MVPLEVWMQPEYILGIAGFKDLHYYGRMRTNDLVLQMLKWTYLQMTQNWEENPNLMLHLYIKTLSQV